MPTWLYAPRCSSWPSFIFLKVDSQQGKEMQIHVLVSEDKSPGPFHLFMRPSWMLIERVKGVNSKVRRGTDRRSVPMHDTGESNFLFSLFIVGKSNYSWSKEPDEGRESRCRFSQCQSFLLLVRIRRLSMRHRYQYYSWTFSSISATIVGKDSFNGNGWPWNWTSKWCENNRLWLGIVDRARFRMMFQKCPWRAQKVACVGW